MYEMFRILFHIFSQDLYHPNVLEKFKIHFAQIKVLLPFSESRITEWKKKKSELLKKGIWG